MPNIPTRKQLNSHVKPPVSLASSLTITAKLPDSIPLIPKIGALPIGQYSSKVKSFSDVVQNGQLVAVDFEHDLVAEDGTNYCVRFRSYVGRELDALLTIFAAYGLTGSLSAVIGLEENVILSQKPSSSYLQISDRSLKKKSLPAVPGSKAKALLVEEDDDEYDDFYEEDGED